MGRTNNFDGLRLIAATMVLLAHMAALGGEQDWIVQGHTWGEIGVFVFFAISGFLVMHSWRSDPDIGRFLARRFLRISPGLVVASVAMYLLVLALGLQGFPGNPRHALNGSLWTIEFEVYCYLILICIAMVSKAPALIAVALCAVAAPLGLSGFLLEFAPFFAVGMLLAEYPLVRRWSWALVALGFACLPYGTSSSMALIIAPVVVAIGARSWPVMRSAGRYGDISYGVYIYAFPIQQIVVAYMGSDAPYLALLSVSLPLIMLAAWASWRFVEAPALLRKPSKPQNPPAAACAAMRADERTEPKPAQSHI
jgi:peptidoglycan/LPS O-acetylase OafA/YrhL